jgi:hypothetical protein
MELLRVKTNAELVQQASSSVSLRPEVSDRPPKTSLYDRGMRDTIEGCEAIVRLGMRPMTVPTRG